MRERRRGPTTARALRAALAVAAEHGLRCDEPVVIRDGTNILARLDPAPVVARLSMTLSLARGVCGVEREVSVARWLAAEGAPTVRPSRLLPPGPHERDGLLVSFWELLDHDGERPLDAREAGRRLRAVHEALAGYPDPLPAYHLDEIETLLDGLEPGGQVAARDLELLRAACEEARRTTVGVALRPLHGDAHLGNVLRTSGGPIWSDLENVCSGPVELDLAGLVHWSRVKPPAPDAEAALAAYGPYDAELLEAMVPIYALVVTAWTIVIARRRPGPATEVVAARLRWWRRRASAG